MDLLEMFITNTINNNEPRVKLIQVDVAQTSGFNENEIEINIQYYVINNPESCNSYRNIKRVR
jgi:predicted component of type VI protein secretion system